MTTEKQQIIDSLKFYHDFRFTPGVYEHSLFGKAAILLEQDSVAVVRCKDCDWHREDGSICVNPHCGKSWYGCRVPEQHYCSYGERREGE